MNEILLIRVKALTPTKWVLVLALLCLFGCKQDLEERKTTGFQQIFADVAEKTVPAVVSIYSEKNLSTFAGEEGRASEENNYANPYDYFFGGKKVNPKLPRQKQTGMGSGVIINPNGTILTNNHVIEDADLIKVRLANDKEYIAKIVGTDKLADVAVIKLMDAQSNLPIIPLGNSDLLRIGEWVVAVGNPYGLSQTVTTGIISAKGRKNTGINSYENFLQTDAAINPGNSGGALVNLQGELIGINTAIYSRSGGYQGIGFAIPINMAKKIMEDLIRDGEVTRGWLGVSIQSVEKELAEALNLQEHNGALVNGVVANGPAANAGIKSGDVIVKIDNEVIDDASDLLNRVALLNPNSYAAILVNREGKKINFKIKIAKRDDKKIQVAARDEQEQAVQLNKVGLHVKPLSSEIRNQYSLEKSVTVGVAILSVDAGSRAAEAGLQEGDVVQEINRVKIYSLTDFNSALSSTRKGNKILLLIYRAKRTFYTTL